MSEQKTQPEILSPAEIGRLAYTIQTEIKEGLLYTPDYLITIGKKALGLDLGNNGSFSGDKTHIVSPWHMKGRSDLLYQVVGGFHFALSSQYEEPGERDPNWSPTKFTGGSISATYDGIPLQGQEAAAAIRKELRGIICKGKPQFCPSKISQTNGHQRRLAHKIAG